MTWGLPAAQQSLTGPEIDLQDDARMTTIAVMDTFVHKLRQLPEGYTEGHYDGHRYGVTRTVSADGRREKLFAQQLGGSDFVSFNLYFVRDGEPRLKPCEMPTDKVMHFVAGFAIESPTGARTSPQNRLKLEAHRR